MDACLDVSGINNAAKSTASELGFAPQNSLGFNDRAALPIRQIGANSYPFCNPDQRLSLDHITRAEDDTSDGSIIGRMLISVLLALIYATFVAIAGHSFAYVLGLYCLTSLAIFVVLTAANLLQR